MGQRLELGNAFGWQGANDPLYPPLLGAAGNTNANMNARRHELKQWKAYRDNLAAAQATAIYHHQGNNGEYPVACMATTAHPGTAQTIANSTTFNNLTYSGALNVDFLTGNGTNGMEFAPLPRATFETTIANANSDLRKAISNLAYFAGDPQGAFPAVQEAAGGVVHPFPTLTMWGDFSNLRRVIRTLNTGTAYTNLSLADRTTLQSAGCTLGMLANNLRTAENEFNSLVANQNSQLVSLGGKFQQLIDNVESNGNPELGWDNSAGRVVLCFNTEEAYFNGSTPATRTKNAARCPGNYANVSGTNTYTPARPGGYQTQHWQDALSLWRGTKSGANVPTQSDIDNLVNYVASLGQVSQIRRDREFGFVSGSAPLTTATGGGNYSGTFTAATGTYATQVSGGSGLPAGTRYGGLGCDPNIFQLNSEQPEIGLAAAVCGSARSNQPRFPALYYLFPLGTHGHSGQQSTAVQTAANTRGYGRQALQHEDLNKNGVLDAGEDLNGNGILDDEDYVSNITIFNPTLVSGINCKPTNAAATACQTDVYRALNDASNDGVDDDPTTSFANVFISPRTTTASWLTPIRVNQAAQVNRITVNGAIWNPAFLDKGIFNGREMMPIRALDVDLDLLRNTQYAGQDFWLPLPAGAALANTGAILYSFREDAMREDAIARPSGASMNATSATPTDPAVNAVTNISPKPVDFYADPDRRPHGFRLRNGLSLVRNGRVNDGRGMSFISDQPVYIQGDFNVHSTNGTTTAANLLQEFTQALLNDWSNFYQRITLDTRFARPTTDTWRPVEILTDAISVLSNTFCDGNILDGLNNANTNSNCPVNGNNSFRNMNQPSTASVWWREGPGPNNDGSGAADQFGNTTFPVAFNRNGLVLVSNGAATPAATPYNNNYVAFNSNTGKARSWASTGNAQVNAVLISGLIPSQAQQSYGGLHNFPRFLENWTLLNFQGSFIQLSFSTYGTAPFDQDAWEPGQPPTSSTVINYYSPPTRRWGFDTALLLAPPGAVSQRFRQLTPNNNEIYRELPKDDPYICLIRKRLEPVDERPDCP